MYRFQSILINNYTRKTKGNIIMANENTEHTENTATAETPVTPENPVIRTFEVPGDFVLEDIYTNPKEKNEKLINDIGQLIVETFGKPKTSKTEKPAKLLKTDDQIDLRLAQLGIDNNFKMCKDPDGKMSYRSHTFKIDCKTE